MVCFAPGRRSKKEKKEEEEEKEEEGKKEKEEKEGQEEKEAGASTFLATEGVWDPNTGSNSQHVLPFHLNCCKIKDIVSKLIDGVWNSFSKMLGGVIKMKKYETHCLV